MFKSLCVFCGSGTGNRDPYIDVAIQLGKLLAEKGIRLVYGGGKVGIMGALARAALDHGGMVTGIVPRFLLEKEVAFREIQDLRVVESMHERKALMAELSEGFIALPGGIGTLEELIEVLTWLQLGVHKKPVAVLNIDGFFDLLLHFLDHLAASGFLHPDPRTLLVRAVTPEVLLKAMDRFQIPMMDKASWALKGRVAPT